MPWTAEQKRKRRNEEREAAEAAGTAKRPKKLRIQVQTAGADIKISIKKTDTKPNLARPYIPHEHTEDNRTERQLFESKCMENEELRQRMLQMNSEITKSVLQATQPILRPGLRVRLKPEFGAILFGMKEEHMTCFTYEVVEKGHRETWKLRCLTGPHKGSVQFVPQACFNLI